MEENRTMNGQRVQSPAKSRIAAGVFGILLGGIGVNNFYLGKTGLGIVDILFCWTGIPSLVNLIRGILYLVCSDDEEFVSKYYNV